MKKVLLVESDTFWPKCLAFGQTIQILLRTFFHRDHSFAMGIFNSKFYNILYVARVALISFSVVTFDWIQLQKWFTLRWKAEQLL